MPSSELLEVKPNKLFEEHSINEIEGILVNVNNEIERRRVELRTLVGERYRDLIDAADKIEEMKVLSNHLINDVEILNYNIGLLNKTHQGHPFIINKNVKTSLIDNATAQLKVLVDLPQLIWSAIDDKELIKASQMYLLARHIKTGFSVDTNLKTVTFAASVLEQQWSLLAKFPSIILKTIEKNLLEPEINPVECSRFLASAALLDSGSLVNKFLNFRESAVSIKFDSDVKAQLLSSYKALITTFEALQYAFIDECAGREGNIWKILDSSCSNLSKPVIQYLDTTEYVKHLPPIILNFRGGTLERVERSSLCEVKSKMKSWLNTIRRSIEMQGRALLKNVSTLKALRPFTSVLQSESCSSTLRKLSLDVSDLWEEMYKPLITSRAKDLISLQWEQALSELCSNLELSVQHIDMKKSEMDLRWYVWKESASDLNLNQSNVGNIRNRGLWLKSKGISPRVSGVCSVLEERLSGLEEDVTILASSEQTVCRDQQALQLINHHQTVCSQTLLRLKEFVGEFVNKVDTNEVKLAIMARLLQSIPELCPSLQKCLTSHSDQSKGWHEAKTLLNAESLSVWARWESMMSEKLLMQLPVIMTESNKLSHLLSSIPQWEVVWIEEGEDESVHRSRLQVPSSPSLHLQLLLHCFSLHLTRAYVPRLIIENLMEKMLPAIIKNYPDEFLCQAQSLQALLDVKFLTTLFVSSTNKELVALCHAKIKQIESTIDPFDLDVYSSHIHANVKSSILKTQCLLGGSIVHKEATTSKSTDDPSIIPLSKGATNVWFPLLPVTNPSNKAVHLKKPKATKVVGKAPESAEVLLKATNVASSFFNEWFG